MASTLAELSEQTGYSTATISRVLNSTGSVGEEIRQTVLAAVRESGYTPRRTVRKAARQSPPIAPQPGAVEVVWHWHSLAEQLVLHDQKLDVSPLAERRGEEMLSASNRLSLSFYWRIIDGILAELQTWGLKAIVQTNNDLLAPQFLADVNQPGKRGVLLLGEYSADVAKFISRCQQPLVLVDQICRDCPDVVTIDNYGGMTQVFTYIHDLGHRDIGFVGAEPDNPSFRERRVAWEWNMISAGLTIQPQWTCEGSSQIEKITAEVTRILKQSSRPSALICCNDNAALGVYRAAAVCGLSIPGDLSVVGFDDIDAASLITPALTTVRVPMVQLGRQAVRLLISQRPESQASQGKCDLRVRTDLVVRKSATSPQDR